APAGISQVMSRRIQRSDRATPTLRSWMDGSTVMSKFQTCLQSPPARLHDYFPDHSLGFVRLADIAIASRLSEDALVRPAGRNLPGVKRLHTRRQGNIFGLLGKARIGGNRMPDERRHVPPQDSVAGM